MKRFVEVVFAGAATAALVGVVYFAALWLLQPVLDRFRHWLDRHP